ncbi:hypothetical protein [Bradyrhizobium genosp. A]|uniref:hypothetical protein n=1 Tax=Bradyrhizobium genosp. A TaxID=83626 RepID=UPI003CEFA637
MRFMPPGVDFDPRLANELARRQVAVPSADEGAESLAAQRRSPLNGYTRTLTPEGGVLIRYRDQNKHPFLTTLRVFAWLVATGLSGWQVLFVSDLSVLHGLLLFVFLTVIITRLARQKIIVAHSVEIRPDAIIIDGVDVFYAEDLGENWPELQMKDDEDRDRMFVGGICGTRFIEYATANRLDKNDRTPEVLAQDLEAAMEQLWGRREVTFATAE